jgi:hypothetical protein
LLPLIPFNPSFLRHKRAGKVTGNQRVAMENLEPPGKPGGEILRIAGSSVILGRCS